MRVQISEDLTVCTGFVNLGGWHSDVKMISKLLKSFLWTSSFHRRDVKCYYLGHES